MLCDGFRHFEQGFELTPGVFQRRGGGYFGRGDSRIRHSRQNSTRVGRRSTKGAMAKRMKLRLACEPPRASPFVGTDVEGSVVR